MARRPTPPRNALGAAIRARRGTAAGEQAAAELSLTANTLYRLERGAHRPSTDTALALARWLGWTVEAVLEAARRPAPSADKDADSG